MSRSRVPFLDELSAPSDDLIAPELFIQPPTPSSPQSEAFHLLWTNSRHLSIGSITTMHHSQSVPKTSILGDLNSPLTRDRRSQSMPLSLNVATLSKKLVKLSDTFEAKHSAVKLREKERSRTLSGSEATTSCHYKRQSDLVEEWIRESGYFLQNKGSPV